MKLYEKVFLQEAVDPRKAAEITSKVKLSLWRRLFGNQGNGPALEKARQAAVHKYEEGILKGIQKQEEKVRSLGASAARHTASASRAGGRARRSVERAHERAKRNVTAAAAAKGRASREVSRYTSSTVPKAAKQELERATEKVKSAQKTRDAIVRRAQRGEEPHGLWDRVRSLFNVGLGRDYGSYVGARISRGYHSARAASQAKAKAQAESELAALRKQKRDFLT